MTMFTDVATMNIAFGNPRGGVTPERLKSQCKNLQDEYEEMLSAIAAKDLVQVRDAACDILVFTFGAFHLMGTDYDNSIGLRTRVQPAAIPRGYGMFEYLKAYADVFPALYGRLSDTLALTNGPPPSVVFDLGDIIDFALGVYTLINMNPHEDMLAVYTSNMSKFCKNEEEMIRSRAKYEALGVAVYQDGNYPTVCLKSARNQTVDGVSYPAHKFLKGVCYKPPVFA